MSLNPINVVNPDGETPKLINWWNYSNPNKAGFSTELVGTVVAIQEYQQTEYDPNPNAPRRYSFWKDGNPKMGIRMLFAVESGAFMAWAFSPASRAAKEGKRKSVHLDLFALTGNTDMKNLIGQTLRIQTQQPPQGFGYGAGNPRPWTVEIAEGVGPFVAVNVLPDDWKVDRLLPDVSASGGQVVQPQQQAQQVYQQPQVQQPVQQYQQPMPQQPQQVYQYQPQPQVQQPMPQYQQQPVQQVPTYNAYPDPFAQA